MADQMDATKSLRDTRRSRFVIEWRKRSRRTETGWTKWQKYIVQPTREDAERCVANLADWCRYEEGEVRIVDREAS